MDKIEKVLKEIVRPALFGHGGDIKSISYKDGVYRYRVLGQCSSCPSGKEHLEALLCASISPVLPKFKALDPDDGISDAMLEEARRILRLSREKLGH